MYTEINDKIKYADPIKRIEILFAILHHSYMHTKKHINKNNENNIDPSTITNIDKGISIIELIILLSTSLFIKHYQNFF